MYRVQTLQAPKINTDSTALQFGQFLMSDAQKGLEYNEQKRQNKALGDYRNLEHKLNIDKYNNQVQHNENMEAIAGQKLSNSFEHDNNILNETKRVNDWRMSPSNPNNNPASTFQKNLVAVGIDPKSERGQQLQKANLYKSLMVDTVDKNGNAVKTSLSNYFPISGNNGNDVEVVKKTNDVAVQDIEDLNKSIEIANSIGYAQKNWKPEYTGMIDDKVNWILNKVGINTPTSQKYNEWVANLQSVANAARNKSFGAALSGFDIEEFAKEFPASDAGDGTVIPKLNVKMDTLNNALKNTYSSWVERYGKERADQYFKGLNDKSFMGVAPQPAQSNQISDQDLLKIITGR